MECNDIMKEYKILAEKYLALMKDYSDLHKKYNQNLVEQLEFTEEIRQEYRRRARAAGIL